MLLNRPSLHGFGRAAYDVVLRCSGIATDFHGYHGRSVDEERFVAWFLAGRPVGVRFDVGAYHGANARHLRRLSSESRIHAFAPYPKSFEILQSSTQFDTSMVLYDFAFEDGSTQASPDESAIKLFAANAMTHDVTVTTIDVFMAGHAIDRVQFLNIDTRVSTLPYCAVHASP